MRTALVIWSLGMAFVAGFFMLTGEFVKNRAVYRDLGLVFAKDHADLFGEHGTLGTPLQMNDIGRGELARLLNAANVRRITFHGLRHTSATLLLLNGEPVKVVSERLGHRQIAITMDTCAHVLRSMGRDAADRLGALLHGAANAQPTGS